MPTRSTILAILLLIVATAPARAAGVIDIGQAFNAAIAPYIDAVVQAVIAAFVLWVAAKIKQKTGIDIDAGHRDALTRALQNQASSLIADGATYIDAHGKIAVNNLAMAKAVNDLMTVIPDAVKHFGLTPEFVARRIVDMIPQISGSVPRPVVNIATAPSAPPAPVKK